MRDIAIDDQPVSATFFGEGRWLTDFITPDTLEVEQLYKNLTENIDDLQEKLLVCWDWVANNVKYVRFVQAKIQINGHSSTQSDYWQTPSQLIRTQVGNCLGAGTKLLVINPQGEYKIEKIENLANYHGYSVVSYNHQVGKVEFKPIIGWFNNGVREVVKVRFNNGESVFSTPDHIFYRVDDSIAKQIPLNEAIQGQANVLNFRRVPPLSKRGSTEYKYSYEHLWVVGHYLAEGYSDEVGRKTVICNDDPKLRGKLCSYLEKLKVPYSKTDYSHSNYVRLLHKKRGSRNSGIDDLKENLWDLGHTAAEKALTSDFLSLGRPQLRAIMDGYCDGDGYLPTRNNKRRVFSSRHQGKYHYKNSYILRYYTASEGLTDQLKLIHLILGRPLYSWYRSNSGGAGKNPLPQWQLIEYSNPSYGRVNCFRDLGNLEIKAVEDSFKMPVYDIEVADNHNFMLANGIMVHNCANKAFLLASLVRNALPAERLYCVLGNLHQEGKPGGHAWVEAHINGDTYVMESTRGDMAPMVAANVADIYESVIYFNDKTVSAVEGRTVLEPFTAVYADWLRDYLDWAYIEGRK